MTFSEMNMQPASESGDFNVFVGAASGLLKGISLNPNTNLCKNLASNLNSLDKSQHEITCMTWISNTEQDKILLGLKNGSFRTFSVSDKKFCDSLKYRTDEHRLDPMVGIASYDGAVLTASESGMVKIWQNDEKGGHCNETGSEDWFNSFDTIEKEILSSGKKLRRDDFDDQEDKEKHMTSMKIGRQLCRMRQSVTDRNLLATGGKENDLQIWDVTNLQNPVAKFMAKNVKPDKLQLRVPVWVSDVCFSDPLTSNAVSTVSKHGHVRLYDIRSGQRRPVIELHWEDEALTTIASTQNKDQVLVASGSGKMALYDYRVTHRGMLRKYKGCVGGIRAIDCLQNKPYFACVSLDRFLRVYNIENQKPIQKMYLKSQLNCVLLTKDFDPNESILEEEKLKKEQEMSNAKKGVSDIIVNKSKIDGSKDDDGEEFWTKLKVIKSSTKSKNIKKSNTNPTTAPPTKRKKSK